MRRHAWLLGGGSSRIVASKHKAKTVCAQSSGSDHNDGQAAHHVDGVLVASVNTWARGSWYLEIAGLPDTTHTVMVVAPTSAPTGAGVSARSAQIGPSTAGTAARSW